MLVDHLGVFFFPQEAYLRIIGRISFPLFSWAIANGSIYTKNINKYLVRIFILALVSQIPYGLLFGTFNVFDSGLNILFTLSLGLLGIIFFKKYKGKLHRLLIAVFLALVAVAIKADYQAFGVLSVLVFYLFFNDFYKIIFYYIGLLVTFSLAPLFINRLIPI